MIFAVFMGILLAVAFFWFCSLIVGYVRGYTLGPPDPPRDEKKEELQARYQNWRKSAEYKEWKKRDR